MSSAWLEVTHEYGRRQITHRDYAVVIDGKVYEGETEKRTKLGWRRRWPVAPGAHTLRVGRGWLTSPEVSFTAAEGKTARFRYRVRPAFSNMAFREPGLAYLLLSVFKHDSWISIERVSRSPGL